MTVVKLNNMAYSRTCVLGMLHKAGPMSISLKCMSELVLHARSWFDSVEYENYLSVHTLGALSLEKVRHCVQQAVHQLCSMLQLQDIHTAVGLRCN